MPDSSQPPDDGSRELARTLQALASSSVPHREGTTARAAREQRMATAIDAEVNRLRRGRLRARVGLGSAVAAAAVALLAWGARARVPAAEVAIAHEPLPASPAAPRLQQPSAPEAAPSTEAMPTAPETKRPPRPASVTQPATDGEASTLGKENALFKAAAEATRDGSTADALALLERLLQEYPSSPLAQTAIVRRFRLLESTGRVPDAQREAERYLRSYPAGFAVAEARALRERSAIDATSPP